MTIIDGFQYYTESELISMGWVYSHTTPLTNSKVYVSRDNTFFAMFFNGEKLAPIMNNIEYRND